MTTVTDRSAIMRSVKSTNTKPELAVRRLLHRLGYRFRLHREDLPGKPDLVFPSRRKVIFIHGCFWHGHDCKRGARKPKQNAVYWSAKIERNVVRDRANLKILGAAGWQILTVWECEIKAHDELCSRLKAFLGEK